MTHPSAPTPPALGPTVCLGSAAPLVQQALALGGRVVVFAPDAAAAATLRAALPAGAADRLAVLTGPHYGGAADIAAVTPGLASAHVVVDAVLERDRPDDLERARAALGRLAFQSRANDGARRASAARYLLHTLSNAPRLSREGDVAALAGLLAGIPAVVVAAGPSLDRNLRELRTVAERVVVIACDTAARPLLSVGIDPHFIVASDPSRANAGHLGALPPSRAWLVGEGSLHPSAFALFDGRTFVFRVAGHEPWPWLETVGVRAAKLETWGSVATSAFSLARHLGCTPIALAGADFAFTDGRPYARGTTFESQWAAWHAAGSSYAEIWQMLRTRWASVTTETALDGRPVETAPHLLAFRDWVHERAAADPTLRIVNATGAGLLMGGAIEQRGLVDLFAQGDSIDRALVDKLLSAAHAQGRGNLALLLEAIPRLASDGDTTIGRWLEFAEGGASVSAVTGALRSHEYIAWTLGRQAAGR